MRLIGTRAMGIRLPIIGKGDDLVRIIVEHITKVTEEEGIILKDTDVIGVTEAPVAKTEGNFASIDDIADDVYSKFGDNEIGLVYPIMSRNRFLRILEAVSKAVKKVHVLLSYPYDEVGNPVMDIDLLDDVIDVYKNRMITAEEFKKVIGAYNHPFTGVDYIELYESAGDNISLYFSNDSRDILQLTPDVLVGEIHNRFYTKNRLIKAGARKVHTLCEVLSESRNGSGFNKKYGVLGSNISTDNVVKLFPNDCEGFIQKLRQSIFDRFGVRPEILVYGDGAIKCPIWELADPVVSPGFTERLNDMPNELKLKYVADNLSGNLNQLEKQLAVSNIIKNKSKDANDMGTTPRKYSDLVGSLCDLISGSGDKGTPVVLIQGYFDSYSAE